MPIIDEYVDAFVEQFGHTRNPEPVKGILPFPDIKNEMGRVRMTPASLITYSNNIKRLGIDVSINWKGKYMQVCISDKENIYLNYSQAKRKIELIEKFELDRANQIPVQVYTDTCIQLPEDIQKQAELEAKAKGISLSEWISKTIQRALRN